jgi:Protein of unknown function (DUF4245)
MVISLVVILLAVLAWVAMVPRVRGISQPAIDVTSVAIQARQESGWAISQPSLSLAWKATNARFDQVAGGARTWHAGYLSPGGQYLSIDQTDVKGATQNWIWGRTSNGQAQGSLTAAGKTWQKVSSPDVLQRSLVSKGSGAGAITTVLSGTATYSQLAQFAQTLKPVPAG